MAMQNLNDLFVDKLKDVYDAERRITKALPKMIKSTSSEELSTALQEHLQITEGQIERLDRIFEGLGETPGRKPCHGMMGILEEGNEVLEKEGPDPVIDAALIAAAQSVEHYEITAYGCLKTWAEQLGMTEESGQLEQSLEEEKEADERLNQIARTINPQAMEAGESSEDDEEGSERETVSAKKRSNGTTGVRKGGTSRSR